MLRRMLSAGQGIFASAGGVEEANTMRSGSDEAVLPAPLAADLGLKAVHAGFLCQGL